MSYLGSVNVMVNGRVVTIPVSKVQYQGYDGTGPGGGVVEDADGSMQIILDASLSEEESQRHLAAAMAEVSRRFRAKLSN
jgi:hypothetical protein